MGVVDQNRGNKCCHSSVYQLNFISKRNLSISRRILYLNLQREYLHEKETVQKPAGS